MIVGFTALLHQFSDDPCPPRLMAGAHARAGVSVKVLVKHHKIAPVRIGLELFNVAEHGPSALLILKKYAGHPARKFPCYLPERQHLSRTGGALHFEVVPEIV